jgi:hypothetical protein
MINAQEGREQYQVCGQNCDPLDENHVTPLFLKVNRSQQPAKRTGIDLRGESDASLGCRCLNTANPSDVEHDVEQDRKMEADDFPSQPLVHRASMARQ